MSCLLCGRELHVEEQNERQHPASRGADRSEEEGDRGQDGRTSQEEEPVCPCQAPSCRQVGLREVRELGVLGSGS